MLGYHGSVTATIWISPFKTQTLSELSLPRWETGTYVESRYLHRHKDQSFQLTSVKRPPFENRVALYRHHTLHIIHRRLHRQNRQQTACKITKVSFLVIDILRRNAMFSEVLESDCFPQTTSQFINQPSLGNFGPKEVLLTNHSTVECWWPSGLVFLGRMDKKGRVGVQKQRDLHHKD